MQTDTTAKPFYTSRKHGLQATRALYGFTVISVNSKLKKIIRGRDKRGVKRVKEEEKSGRKGVKEEEKGKKGVKRGRNGEERGTERKKWGRKGVKEEKGEERG